jgi:dTDP-4-amino-4,6-dideoxygalactose transaminase
MLNTSFSPWPCFTQEEADAVSRVLLSNKVNYWTGQECREFEREFATWCGTEYAVALANGTLALDVALKALGVGAGDEVIVTPRTFIASASCIVTAGATPVFADVDLNTQAITAETISAVISYRTKAIIVVHLGGMPADMDPIMELANTHGIYVIEDCAQAHGAKYKGKSVGSIGHVGAWSFCQDKIMTTGGEGGMVTTNDKALWNKMWSYKDHGKSWEAVYERQHPPGFRWLHETIGTNWRMMEMQAVIGRIQLKKMEDWTLKRQANAKIIAAALSEFSCIRLQKIPNYAEHAQYKFYAFLIAEKLKTDFTRDSIINKITSLGIPCYQGSCSQVFKEKAFSHLSLQKRDLPNTQQLGNTSIMMLVHPTLTDKEILRTCTILKLVLQEATKG